MDDGTPSGTPSTPQRQCPTCGADLDPHATPPKLIGLDVPPDRCASCWPPSCAT